MKSLSKICLSICTAAFVAGVAWADGTTAAAKVIAERFGVKIKSARHNSDLNLVEILVENGDLVYVTPDAKYLISGVVIDVNARKNLTQAALDDLTRFAPKEIPESFMFSRAARGGNGQQLWVFTDPKCPYCRQLEPELDKLTNVKINYIPLAFQRSDNEVAAVLCAKDKLKAWKEVVEGKLGSGTNPTKGCMEMAAKIREFAQSKSIVGTPTILRADGARLAGYTSAERIMEFLSGK